MVDKASVVKRFGLAPSRGFITSSVRSLLSEDKEVVEKAPRRARVIPRPISDMIKEHEKFFSILEYIAPKVDRKYIWENVLGNRGSSIGCGVRCYE